MQSIVRLKMLLDHKCLLITESYANSAFYAFVDHRQMLQGFIQCKSDFHVHFKVLLHI